MAAKKQKATAKKPRASNDVWKKAFLVNLSKMGNVTRAAKVAKVSRVNAHKARHRSKDFAKKWGEALEEAADVLEAEAHRRAVTGTRKGIYHLGKLTATERQYSDALLIFLLKATRPTKFRDNVAHEHSGSVGQEHSGGLDLAHSGKVDNRVVFEFHRPGGAVEYRHQVGVDPPDNEGEEAKDEQGQE